MADIQDLELRPRDKSDFSQQAIFISNFIMNYNYFLPRSIESLYFYPPRTYLFIQEMVQIRKLSSLKSIHLVASFVIGLSISYHKSR